MIRKILFAADFSAESSRAEAYAADLARALGATLEVFHAIEPIARDPDERAFDDIYIELLERSERASAALLQRLRGAGVECVSKVTIERRWRAIVDRAQAVHADLIVMGSGAPNTSDASSAPSTSYQVFLASPTPVLVVRSQDASDRLAAAQQAY